MISGVNINCCSKELFGLAAALSPQTSFSYKHGFIKSEYPVELYNVTYMDVWDAYKALCKIWKSTRNNPDLAMTYVLKKRFEQHKKLLHKIQELGGDDWIDLCSHIVTDEWKKGSKWQGIQRQSLYIRCLSSAVYSLFNYQNNDEPDPGYGWGDDWY